MPVLPESLTLLVLSLLLGWTLSPHAARRDAAPLPLAALWMAVLALALQGASGLPVIIRWFTWGIAFGSIAVATAHAIGVIAVSWRTAGHAQSDETNNGGQP